MLTEEEEQIYNTILKRNQIKLSMKIHVDRLEAVYQRQGNYTICVLFHDVDLLSMGVTKRNPKDEINRKIGENRAFERTVKNLMSIPINRR